MLLRQLPVEYLKRPVNWKYAPVEAGESECTISYSEILYVCSGDPAGRNTLITVRERTVQFGKPRDHPTFGWDLEYGTAVMQ